MLARWCSQGPVSSTDRRLWARQQATTGRPDRADDPGSIGIFQPDPSVAGARRAGSATGVWYPGGGWVSAAAAWLAARTWRFRSELTAHQGIHVEDALLSPIRAGSSGVRHYDPRSSRSSATGRSRAPRAGRRRGAVRPESGPNRFPDPPGVARVLALAGPRRDLAIRLARPGRIARLAAARLRRRQIACRRNDERRALAVVDAGSADIDAHAAQNVLDDLLLERVVVFLRLLGVRARPEAISSAPHTQATQAPAQAGSIMYAWRSSISRAQARALPRIGRLPDHSSRGIRALLRRRSKDRTHTGGR